MVSIHLLFKQTLFCLIVFLNIGNINRSCKFCCRFCPTCKEHRQASKKLDLWRLPDILIIHLKRFSYTRFLNNKLESFVDFPIEDFDLSNYILSESNKDRPRYKLYAISNHYGGLGGGHYTAYAEVSVNSE